MFGLWYISLAFDELRKHFGWTFFGLFNNNNNNDNSIKKGETILPGNNGNELKNTHNDGKVLEIETNNKNKEKKEEPIVPKSDLVEPKKPATVVLPKVEQKEPPKEPAIVPEPEKPKIKPSAAVIDVPAKPEPQRPNKTDESITNGSSITAPISLPSPKKPIQDAENNLLKLNNNKLPINNIEKDKLTSNSNMGDSNLNGSLNKPNMKNATNSFLAEESSGGLGKPKPKTDMATKRNKSDTMVDAAVLEKLEAGFAKLSASNSKSLLKKYLTKTVFDNLKNKVTPTFKSTLLDVIQSGLENHDSGVGIYAPDAESYTTFAELFDPIIEDYHGGFKKTDKHPQRNFGDVSVFSNLDPNSEFVVSTRVRCGRSMEGYPFNPCLTEAQYKEMESKVSSTLSGLEGELKGKFYPLTGMEKSVQQQLIDDHFLFKEGDRFLQSANACRYWPSGRGIYHNDAKTFLVWCNEEDHLRIISMQMGGDLGQVYSRLVTAVNDIEKRIPFSHNDRLGFLTFCPTNLGTTIRASVHIKVPKLAANLSKLEEIAGKYNLQVRGTRGEHTEAEGGIYDISNKRRMGLTEFDAVKEMYDGIAELIKIEKSL